jgi:hypothetical protein
MLLKECAFFLNLPVNRTRSKVDPQKNIQKENDSPKNTNSDQQVDESKFEASQKYQEGKSFDL